MFRWPFFWKDLRLETLDPAGAGASDAVAQWTAEPGAPLPRGWYHFRLDGVPGDVRSAGIHFDLGDGFNKTYRARLHPAGHGYRAIVRLNKAAVLLRVDVRGAPERAEAPALSLRSLAEPELTLRRLAHLGWAALADRRRLRPEHLRASILARRGFLALPPRLTAAVPATAYQEWIACHDYDLGRDRAPLAAALRELPAPPKISVLLPVSHAPRKHLEAALDSVVRQLYPNWELCIAGDDGATAPGVRRALEKWARRDGRIKTVFRHTKGRVPDAMNAAFELATGEWIAPLDPDGVLPEHALAEIALALARTPGTQAVYTDQDKIGSGGVRSDPHFKCDFSPELFRSMNYLGRLTVHRARNIAAAGGWRPSFEGGHDYDLNLRICERIGFRDVLHIPKVLYHSQTGDGAAAPAGEPDEGAYVAGLRALEEHTVRSGLDAKVTGIAGVPCYRVWHSVRSPAPLVSLIVPTRDRADVLRRCVDSIFGKTVYPSYEVIVVDNGSAEPAALRLLDELRQRPDARVVSYPHAFNFSAINNFAAGLARGDILGLVNNDVEVIAPEWLTEMVSWAQQDEIGCVGAKLYYPDGSIQHAGIVLGIGGVAGHAHKRLPGDAPGYFSRLRVVQNVSAVTGACLLVRKKVYWEAGGFDADHLGTAYNDVDFCLRVRELGYRNVWTPFAELYHRESTSRGYETTPEKQERLAREARTMLAKWKAPIARDPCYSPNLTLEGEDFAIRTSW